MLSSVTLLALLPLIAAQAPRTLLITSPSTSLPACIQDTHYGTYGARQEAVYLPSEACLAQPAALDSLFRGSLVPADVVGKEGSTLLWVGEAGIVHAPKDEVHAAWAGILERNAAAVASLGSEHAAQAVLSSSSSVDEPELIYSSPSMLLVSVPTSQIGHFSSSLPPHLVPVALPSTPTSQAWETVPAHQVAFLADVTRNASFDARIDTILETLDEDEIRRDVRWLTGEGPSGIMSRHSFTQGALQAAHWIRDEAEKSGANCTLQPFLFGFSPNVICHYAAAHPNPARNHTVIVSAHYDSRGSFGSTRAPGGNDDGSGSGHLLALARAIGKAKLSFQSQVTLAWFAGEEQGLFGSRAYAAKLKEEKAEVALQIQADMLGYHVPGETLQLALPESIGLPEAGWLLGNLSRIYSPELVIGTTPACCSDHQNFVANGFPATAVYERNGPIADPEYHSSGDVSQREGYDFSQIKSIAKVTLASLLEVAGFDVPE